MSIEHSCHYVTHAQTYMNIRYQGHVVRVNKCLKTCVCMMHGVFFNQSDQRSTEIRVIVQNKLLPGAFPFSDALCPLPRDWTAVCNDVAPIEPPINRPAGGTTFGRVGKGVGDGVGWAIGCTVLQKQTHLPNILEWPHLC